MRPRFAGLTLNILDCPRAQAQDAGVSEGGACEDQEYVPSPEQPRRGLRRTRKAAMTQAEREAKTLAEYVSKQKAYFSQVLSSPHRSFWRTDDALDRFASALKPAFDFLGGGDGEPSWAFV